MIISSEVNPAINLRLVKEKIAVAAKKSGRTAGDITLVAVTKTITAATILKVVEEGITELGENRVQELTEKYNKFKERCNWHLIGHLQTNKVKYIIDKVKLIHSVDSMELADEIQKRSDRKSVV